MTTLDHLRKLTERPPRISPLYQCGYCPDERDYVLDGHDPDCPWLAAKAYVDQCDETDRLNAPNTCGPLSFDAIESVTIEVGPPLTDGEKLQARFNRRGFTLLELLVVIAIVIVVSAVALPTVLSALSHRQVSEGARTLSAALAGARDAAIRDNAPRGIRLLADPTFNGINPATGLLDASMPLAANRIIPIGSPPNYTEGRLILYPGPGLPPAVAALPYQGPGTPTNPSPTWGTLSGCPLMVYESPVDANGLPNNPTSWFWNIRLGDSIQINNVGPWYTIVGPMVARNPELFVNVGPPGMLSPLTLNGVSVEFLLLVNGRDDNNNGWKDEGWDGIDNDHDMIVDGPNEWETESP